MLRLLGKRPCPNHGTHQIPLPKDYPADAALAFKDARLCASCLRKLQKGQLNVPLQPRLA